MHAAPLLLALLPAVAAGSFSTGETARMDRVVRYVMQDRSIDGCAVGVRRGSDGAHFERAYGFAAPSHARPVNLQTAFAIGSLSKTVLAAAVIEAAGSGTPDLDAPVLRYLPASGIAPAVTVRELLDQTAGLPDYTQFPGFDRFSREPVAPDALLAGALARPAAFAPGTAWAYSNTNYLALGLAVQSATGRPLAAWLHDGTFAPLNMRATQTWNPQTAQANRAAGNVPWGSPSLWFASGDLESNVPDLERFADALYGGRFGPGTLERMTQPAVLADGSLAPYGMGFFATRFFGVETAYQNGFVNGFSSILALVPDRKLAAVALCNADRVDLIPLAESLVAAALDVEEAHPRGAAR